MPTRKFEKGANVYGLWPGSGGLYFKGVVVSIDNEFGTYDVQFEEGTVYTLMERHVRAVDSFKNQEAKVAPRVRRGRSTSSSRSTSRSRSRTPGRSKNTIPPSSPNSKKGFAKPSKQQEKKELSKVEEPEVKESPKKDNVTNPPNDTSMKDQSHIGMKKELPLQDDDALLIRRRSARIATKIEAIKAESGLALIPETKINGTKETKNENNNELSESDPAENATQMCPVPSEKFSMFVSLCLPFLVLFIYFICHWNKCALQNVTLLAPLQLSDLYNPTVFAFLGGFYIFVALLSLKPFDESVTNKGTDRLKALIFTILLLSLAVAKHRFGLPIANVLSNMPQVIFSITVLVFMLSFIAFWLSRKNSAGFGMVSDYFKGSTEDVRMWKLSFQNLLHWYAHATVITLNYLFTELYYELNHVSSPTFLLGVAMQTLYALENLLNDVETLHANRFKIGWILISRKMFFPYLIAVANFYSLNFRREEVSIYVLVPVGMLFFQGMLIKTGSLKQGAFEQGSDNPSSEPGSMATSTTQTPAISGWHKWVRHPRSLGEILINITFPLVCGFDGALPYIVASVLTLIILDQACKNDYNFRKYYGPSWDRYCQRVSSRVIPRIF